MHMAMSMYECACLGPTRVNRSPCVTTVLRSGSLEIDTFSFINSLPGATDQHWHTDVGQLFPSWRGDELPAAVAGRDLAKAKQLENSPADLARLEAVRGREAAGGGREGGQEASSAAPGVPLLPGEASWKLVRMSEGVWDSDEAGSSATVWVDSIPPDVLDLVNIDEETSEFLRDRTQMLAQLDSMCLDFVPPSLHDGP